MIWLLISVVLLIVLIFFRIDILLVAPIVSVFLCLVSGLDVVDTLAEGFMPAFATFAKNNFLIFMTSAMFARAMQDTGMAASPPIVLMDEPFGALDPQTREALQDEVKNLQQRLGKTIIFVTHDMDEALKLADIIIFMDGGEVVQMASPEEMLENPATERVRNFLGKHASGTQPPSKVEQFMRTNVQSVQRDRGVLECAERMARHSVDTLLVVDECNRYAGTVSIGDIRAWGKELKTIDPIVRQTARTVRVGDDAKESFDFLLESGASYVIVLNEDDTVAGIVTKTSVARAVAETLWGDEK